MVVSRRCPIVRPRCGRAPQQEAHAHQQVVPNIASDQPDATRDFDTALLGSQVTWTWAGS
jgi:hypothetical protein